MPIRSLGYLRLATQDMDAWRRFAVDFLGMMPTEGNEPDSLYLRMDDYPPRVVVSPGPESGLQVLGFEMNNAEELDELAAEVEHSGTKVSTLDAAECEERWATGGIRFDDPGGLHIEAFYGPVLSHTPAVTPLVSRFVTGNQGMGHVVITAPDEKPAYDFYTKTLGMKPRNTMRIPGPPGPDGKPVTNSLWFLGCNPRHHTVGILPLPGPGRLIHFMVEAASLDDVGRAVDRAEELQVPVMQTLGRHTNDRMVSFYVIAPDGFAVEFGWDGMQVLTEQPIYEITKGEFWGHKFVNAPQL